jgi:hypothetical protein
MGHPIYAEIPNDYQRLNDAYSEPRLVDSNSELGTTIGEFASKLAGIAATERKAKPRGLFGLRGKK